MTNIELQEKIVQNLLLGLQKQSEAYLDLISDNQYTHEQRKDFEKELSDINKVLNELSGKTINYTVSELEALKVQFNDRLTQLNSIITNLEINTLKIEFDSLTPEQKAFLKGEKGDKGENGENSYQLAVRYGFVGNEIEYLNSLKGKDGVNGVDGIKGADGENGLSAYELAVNNGFEGTQSEWLESLKGSGAGEGGANLSLPIEIQDVNELGSNLAQIFQTLGTLQGAISGGTIAGININQLDGQFQGFKSSSTSQLDYINKILQGGELYNVALDTTIQYEGLMNIVQDLTSRIMVLEDK